MAHQLCSLPKCPYLHRNIHPTMTSYTQKHLGTSNTRRHVFGTDAAAAAADSDDTSNKVFHRTAVEGTVLHA